MKNEDFFSFQETDTAREEEAKKNGEGQTEGDTPTTPTDDSSFFMPPVGADGQIRIPHGMPTEPQKGKNLPLVSLILSLLSFCCCGLPFSIAAIVVAVVSRNKLGRWDGLAIAGIIIGIFSVVMTVAMLVLAFFVELMAAMEGEGAMLALLP